MKKNKKKFLGFFESIWAYGKYQIITKGILSIIVFPLSSYLINILLRSTGRSSITSGDYLDFLFSFQGIGMLIIFLFLLVVLVAIDINAFIIMSALIKENKVKLTAKNMILVGLKSVKSFIKPSGVFLMLYIALVIPLIGIGFSISPMKDFQIPNFITDVIFKNSLYKGLYVGIMILFSYLSLKYIFTFHYILIENNSIINGLKKASKLMKKHWKTFIKDFVLMTIIFFAPFVISAVIFNLLYVIFASILTSPLINQRILTIMSVLVYGQLMAIMSLMSIPIFSYKLTDMFYKYNFQDGNEIKIHPIIEDKSYILTEKERKNNFLLFKILIFSVFIFTIALSIIMDRNFDDFFYVNKDIEIVAHRGGGDLGPENTILGLKKAIEAGVKWSEIDVQRTKDNDYIINHDSNFARLTGDSRKAKDMTLKEIKGLEVRDLFDPSRPGEKVASLDEFLYEAKDKIGLFIELKGETADKKMVDDVVERVKSKGMLNQVALLSLDYKLIEYIDANYPEVKSGFLYFFSIGSRRDLKGDFLIMEEGEATEAKIKEIHEAGKKAYVWTINTKESIDKFVKSSVDGIITDYINDLKKGIEERDNRTDLEIIIDEILGF